MNKKNTLIGILVAIFLISFVSAISINLNSPFTTQIERPSEILDEAWLNFDGVNDNVTIPDKGLFNLTSNFSILVEIKDNGKTGYNPYLISKRNATSNGFNIFLFNGYVPSIVDGSGTTISNSNNINQGSNTDLLIYVFNESGTGFKIYRNGYTNNLDWTTMVKFKDSTNIDLLFGNRIGGLTTNNYNGSIYRAIIYNGTLNKEQVKRIYLYNQEDGQQNYSINPHYLINTSTSTVQVRIPYQQNSFYTNGRYWVFYSNFSNNKTYYKSSTDGISWQLNTEAFGFNHYDAEWTIYFNGSVVDYARSVTYNDTYAHLGLYYGRGIPLSNGTINWTSREQVIFNNSTYVNDHTITIDSQGYPWIAMEDQFPPIKSIYNNGTFIRNTTIQNGSAYSIILSLPNNNIYSLDVPWNEDIKVKGQLWNGTNWTQENNISQSLIESNTGNAAKVGRISAISDEIGNIHLVFQSNEQKIIYMKRNNTNGWSNEMVLSDTYVSSNNSHPAISFSDNGKLVVTWEYAKTDTDYIIMKVYDGTNWLNENIIITDRLNTEYGHNLLSRKMNSNSTFGLTYLKLDGTQVHNIINISYIDNLTNLKKILDLELNENTGTIAYDSSGNGNNGTISGATWESLMNWTIRDNYCPATATFYETILSNLNTDAVSCKDGDNYNLIIINTADETQNVEVTGLPSSIYSLDVDGQPTYYLSNGNPEITLDSYEVLFLGSSPVQSYSVMVDETNICPNFFTSIANFFGQIPTAVYILGIIAVLLTIGLVIYVVIQYIGSPSSNSPMEFNVEGSINYFIAFIIILGIFIFIAVAFIIMVSTVCNL